MCDGKTRSTKVSKFMEQLGHVLRGLQRTNGNFGQSATVLPPGDVEQHSTLFEFQCSSRQVAIRSIRDESQQSDGCQHQEHDIDQSLLQQRQIAGRRLEMMRSFVPDDVLEPIDGSIQRIVNLVLQQLRHASNVFLVPVNRIVGSVRFKVVSCNGTYFGLLTTSVMAS